MLRILSIICLIVLCLPMSAPADNNARICVTRERLSNKTDKFPVHITINGKDIFHLMGGGEKCISFGRAGTFKFTAYSPNLENPDDRSLGVTHSEALIVKISEGEEIVLNVAAVPFVTEFPMSWILQRDP